MHMIAPVSAGTDSVRGEQHPGDARQRGRQGRDDHGGIDPALEVHHDQQVDQHDRAQQAKDQADERGVHRFHLAAQLHRRALGQVRLRRVQHLLHITGDGAQIAALRRRVDVERRLNGIVRDHGGRRFAVHRAERAQKLHVAGRPPLTGMFWRSGMVSVRYCGVWTTMG
jgi:hypothetical protein